MGLDNDRINRPQNHLKGVLFLVNKAQTLRRHRKEQIKLVLMLWILANFFFIVWVTEISSQTLTNCSLLPCNSCEHKETKELQFVLGTSRAEQTIIIDPSPHKAQTQCSSEKAPSSHSPAQLCFALFFLHTGGCLLLRAVLRAGCGSGIPPVLSALCL